MKLSWSKGVFMQINKIKQSPNFGMALKLRPSLRKTLQNSSMELINKLDKIGTDLSNTKYYHLEIDGDLRPHITSTLGKYYRAPFDIVDIRSGYNSRYMQVEAVWDGCTEPHSIENRYRRLVNGKWSLNTLILDSNEDVKTAYAKFKAMPTDIDKGAFLVKLLDSSAQKKYDKNLSEADIIKAKVQNLFEKYGTKPIEV